MWRGLAVVVLVVAGVVLLPRSASACSCAYGDPREMLANGDAAFVGTLVDREEPANITSSADEVTYTFEVEQSVKGDLGETVEVESAIEGASCGFEVAEGQRVGVVLYRDGDRWTGGLCSQIDPDALIRASQPIPSPDGEGPVALLMPNPTGASAIVALDAQGRVLAYVESETGSRIERTAVCPGSERVVEFVFEGRFPRLAVRNLRTLEVERILRPDGLVPDVRAMECLTPDGGTVLLHQTNLLETGGETRIVRVQSQEATVIYQAETRWIDYITVAFDSERGVAYTVDPENRFQMLAVDLNTGEPSVVAQIGEPDGDFGGIFQMVTNPTGTRLAVVVEQPMSALYQILFIIDLTTEPAATTKVGDDVYSFTSPTWVAEDRLLVNGYRDSDQDVLIFNGSGMLVRTVSDLWMQPVVARGDIVYGVGSQGMGGSYPTFPSLFSITLPDGEPIAIRPIDHPYVEDLVAVPDDIEIEATVTPPEEATVTPTLESITPPAESTATPPDSTATPAESGQVGGEGDDPSDSAGAAASTDSGTGFGMEETALVGLALGAVALGGWLVLRRRRHPEPAVEPRT